MIACTKDFRAGTAPQASRVEDFCPAELKEDGDDIRRKVEEFASSLISLSEEKIPYNGKKGTKIPLQYWA